MSRQRASSSWRVGSALPRIGLPNTRRQENALPWSRPIGLRNPSPFHRARHSDANCYPRAVRVCLAQGNQVDAHSLVYSVIFTRAQRLGLIACAWRLGDGLGRRRSTPCQQHYKKEQSFHACPLLFSSLSRLSAIPQCSTEQCAHSVSNQPNFVCFD
jgi:hypothetical protein